MRVLALACLLLAAVGAVVATDAEVEVAPAESLVETDAEFEHLVADAEADELEGLSQQTSDAAAMEAEEESEDLGEEIGEDTPLRQAQRAMIAEREEAVATATPLVLAEADTSADTAAEAKAEAQLPGDFPPVMSRRVSGAADSFPLNDRMCVMCQFLVQRGQQDMAQFYGTNSENLAAAAAQAGAGMATPLGFSRLAWNRKGVRGGVAFRKPFAAWSPTNAANAAAAGGNADAGAAAAAPATAAPAEGLSFIESTGEDVEAEVEEGEDESEDVSSADIEFDAESESEWQTPEYSLIEGDAATEDKSDEELAAEKQAQTQAQEAAFQTPTYQDSVYQQESAEDNSENVDFEKEQNDADAGTADSTEPVFFESAAKSHDESEGEWATPEYSDRTAAAPAAQDLTEDEANAEIDAAEADADAEAAEEEAEAQEESEDEVADAVLLQIGEGTTDADADADADADGDETQDESEEEEAAGETAADSSQEGDWQTPAYTERAAPSSSKEYARVVMPSSLLEATAAAQTKTQAEQSSTITLESEEAIAVAAAVAAGKGQTFGPRMIASGANGRIRFGGRREPALMLRARQPTPRRYFAGDRHFTRPRWNRFDPNSPRHPNPLRVQALKIYEDATHQSYDRLEAYCSTRLPESYGKYCRPILRQYRWVSEGLRYGDRPEQICMSLSMCPQGSYIPNQPHQLLPRF